MTSTFTFIADYLGGTYICQQSAGDLRTACFKWKDHVSAGHYIPNLDITELARAFDADIDELPPVAIDEVSNVWLFQLLLGGDMLNLHIVQTDLSVTEITVETQSGQIVA